MVWGVQAILDAVTLSAHEFASCGPASLRLALLMALIIKNKNKKNNSNNKQEYH